MKNTQDITNVATKIKLSLENNYPMIVHSQPGMGAQALIKEVAKENGIEPQVIELAGSSTAYDVIEPGQMERMQKALAKKYSPGDVVIVDVGVMDGHMITNLYCCIQAMKNLNIKPIIQCTSNSPLNVTCFTNTDVLLKDIRNWITEKDNPYSSKSELVKVDESLIQQGLSDNAQTSKLSMLDKIKNVKKEVLGNNDSNAPTYKN